MRGVWRAILFSPAHKQTHAHTHKRHGEGRLLLYYWTTQTCRADALQVRGAGEDQPGRRAPVADRGVAPPAVVAPPERVEALVACITMGGEGGEEEKKKGRRRKKRCRDDIKDTQNTLISSRRIKEKEGDRERRRWLTCSVCKFSSRSRRRRTPSAAVLRSSRGQEEAVLGGDRTVVGDT